MVKIVVVGSINMDLNCYAEKLPCPGETLLGDSFATSFGGKGANQAIQAARLFPKGQRHNVTMAGKVGNDSFGKQYLEFFKAEGLDTCAIKTEEKNIATGIAQITVSLSDGENSIVVVPGANHQFFPQDLQTSELRTLIKNSTVLLLQNEIPLATTIEAMRIAKDIDNIENKGTTSSFIIFSPAPAVKCLPAEAFCLPDLIIVNQIEAQQLLDETDTNHAENQSPEKLAMNLKTYRKCRNVIVTLGGEGCCVATETGDCKRIPAVKVPKEKIIDAVGAGDSFAASIGYFIANGVELKVAATRAQTIAAMTIQKKGASASYPYCEDLTDLSIFNF